MSTRLAYKLIRRSAATFGRRKWVMRFARLRSNKMSDSMISRCFAAVAANEALREETLENVEYLVYYGEPQAKSHHDMWDPVFAKIPGKYISVFRGPLAWWPLIQDPTVYPVHLLAQNDALFRRLPNLKAVFYPANNGLNIQAIRNTDIQHIFLGHGDSNKASSANKVFRLYDEVWVAGQAHIDRFKHTPGNYSSIDFHIIGQPWMADWLNNRPVYTQTEQVDWGYFPTWSGYYRDSNYASLSELPGICAVARDFAGAKGQGYIKPHPWTKNNEHAKIGQQVSSYSDITLSEKSEKLQTVLKQPMRFIICDVSAALTECLYLNVPLFLYKPAASVAPNPLFDQENAFCYIFQTAEELRALLQRVVANHDDNLAQARTAAVERFVDIPSTRSDQFFKELDRLSRPQKD